MIRKRNIFFWSCPLMLFCLVMPAWAQEKIIKLKDGVVLRGEVVPQEDNITKVSSKSLGNVFVKRSEIVSIEDAPLDPSPVASHETQPLVNEEALRQKITSNPQTMASMQKLAEDQSIVQLLADPALRDAIVRKDVSALKDNANFKKLMENPNMQEIVRQLATGSDKTKE